MTDTDTTPTVTLTRGIGDRRTITVTAALVKLDGNERPYFSVTAEERNLRRTGDNQIECAGQMHDDVLRHFPHLAPVVALHLADDRGVPMYAVENGAHWLGLGDPRYVPEGAPRLDIFASLWRVDEQRARELYDYANADPHPTEALHFLARGERDRWQREADEAVALIRALATSTATEKESTS